MFRKFWQWVIPFPIQVMIAKRNFYECDFYQDGEVVVKMLRRLETGKDGKG